MAAAAKPRTTRFSSTVSVAGINHRHFFVVLPTLDKFNRAAVHDDDDIVTNEAACVDRLIIICELLKASMASAHPDASLTTQQFLTHTMIEEAVVKRMCRIITLTLSHHTVLELHTVLIAKATANAVAAAAVNETGTAADACVGAGGIAAGWRQEDNANTAASTPPHLSVWAQADEMCRLAMAGLESALAACTSPSI